MAHRKSYTFSPGPKEKQPSFSDEGTFRFHPEESEASPALPGGGQIPGSPGGDEFVFVQGHDDVFQELQDSGSKTATDDMTRSPLKESTMQTNGNNACNVESYYFFDDIVTSKPEKAMKDRNNFKDIFKKVLSDIRSGKSPKAARTKAVRQDGTTEGNKSDGGKSKIPGRQEKSPCIGQLGHISGSGSGAIGKQDIETCSQMDNTETESMLEEDCLSNSSETQSIVRPVTPGNMSQGYLELSNDHFGNAADCSCQVSPTKLKDSSENDGSSSDQSKFSLCANDSSNNNLCNSSKTFIDTDWIFGTFPSDQKQSYQSNNSHNEDPQEPVTGQSDRTASTVHSVQDDIAGDSSCSAIDGAKNCVQVPESKSCYSAISIEGEADLSKDTDENNEYSNDDLGDNVGGKETGAISDIKVSLCEDVAGEKKPKSGCELVVDRVQFSHVVWTVMRFLSDAALEKARRTFSVGDDQLMRIRQQQPAGAKSTNSNSNIFASVKEEDEATSAPPPPSSPSLPGQPAANQESAFEDVFTPNSLTETQKKARNM
ncbi:uncharacterized protein LOC115929229 isoform X1 [Strongylocentrotus purpuratus]|uniref:Uncharacterized protein n=1 Tax=Strongylocentrotus purpuratus TaxID=7668 RepID=A0A7M7PQ78_STRPU|nr:uncharacterized protein LOC115929229 isoform X1 [Strongylocentrotus purpuratus]